MAKKDEVKHIKKQIDEILGAKVVLEKKSILKETTNVKCFVLR